MHVDLQLRLRRRETPDEPGNEHPESSRQDGHSLVSREKSREELLYLKYQVYRTRNRPPSFPPACFQRTNGAHRLSSCRERIRVGYDRVV
jgi:hypothetical protein